MSDDKKAPALRFFAAGVVGIIGVGLIGLEHWQLIGGILLLIWANNISQKP